MTVQKVLLLGHPKLYQVCDPVRRQELPSLEPVIQDLHDTLFDFRRNYGVGRAIAAPQIGVMKRLVYMYIDSPTVFINPVIDQQSADMLSLWDDCMCFPDLIVKVERHRRCRITFLDRGWQEQSMRLEDDLSELLQHECDHLDGVLAVARAIDATSFALRSQKALLS